MIFCYSKAVVRSIIRLFLLWPSLVVSRCELNAEFQCRVQRIWKFNLTLETLVNNHTILGGSFIYFIPIWGMLVPFKLIYYVILCHRYWFLLNVIHTLSIIFKLKGIFCSKGISATRPHNICSRHSRSINYAPMCSEWIQLFIHTDENKKNPFWCSIQAGPK